MKHFISFHYYSFQVQHSWRIEDFQKKSLYLSKKISFANIVQVRSRQPNAVVSAVPQSELDLQAQVPSSEHKNPNINTVQISQNI